MQGGKLHWTLKAQGDLALLGLLGAGEAGGWRVRKPLQPARGRAEALPGRWEMGETERIRGMGTSRRRLAVQGPEGIQVGQERGCMAWGMGVWGPERSGMGAQRPVRHSRVHGGRGLSSSGTAPRTAGPAAPLLPVLLRQQALLSPRPGCLAHWMNDSGGMQA